MALSPKLLPGPLHQCNRGCMAWDHHSLLAYGSNSYIVVLDTQNLSVSQTLDEHRAVVTSVAWAPTRLHAELDSPYRLLLASGDLHGNIIVWNVVEASVQCLIQDPNISLPVAQMRWDPQAPNLLLVLYSISNFSETLSGGSQTQPTTPGRSGSTTGEDGDKVATATLALNSQIDSTLALWDTSTGTKMWEKKEIIASVFDFDPFNPSYLCLATSSGTISLLSDYSHVREPETLFPQFHVNVSTHGPKWRPIVTYSLLKISDQAAFIRQQQERPSPGLKDFKGIFYSPNENGIVFVVLDRSIFVMDLRSQVEIGRLSLDDPALASFSDFRICPLFPHLAYTLHANGSVAVWQQRDPPSPSTNAIGVSLKKDVLGKRTYQLLVSSDNLRTKSRRAGGVCISIQVDPCDGRGVLALHPDGTIFRFEINFSDPKFVVISGMFESLPPQISSVSAFPMTPLSRSQPALSSSFSTQSPEGAKPPLVAVGTQTGLLFILDLVLSKVVRQFVVSPEPLQDVKWVSSTEIICFSTKKLESGRYKNRIYRIDTLTGLVSNFRNKSEEETYIKSIIPSPNRRYLIVLLHERPIELWGLTTRSLLSSIDVRDTVTLAWVEGEGMRITGSKNHPQGNPSEGESPLKREKGGSGKNTGETEDGAGVDSTKPLTLDDMGGVPSPKRTVDQSSPSLNSSPDLVGRIIFVTSAGVLRSWIIRHKQQAPLPAPRTTTPSGASPTTLHALSSSPSPPLSPSSSSSPSPVASSSSFPSFLPSFPLFSSSSPTSPRSAPVSTSQDFATPSPGVTLSPELRVDLSNMAGAVTAMACKNNWVICGDVNGMLHCLDFHNKSSRTYRTNRGAVRRITFVAGNGEESLVHFKNGEMGVWDFRQSLRRSISSYLKCRDIRVIDMDWISLSNPLVATSDGCLRLMDRSLSISNSKARSSLFRKSTKLHTSLESYSYPVPPIFSSIPSQQPSSSSIQPPSPEETPQKDQLLSLISGGDLLAQTELQQPSKPPIPFQFEPLLPTPSSSPSPTPSNSLDPFVDLSSPSPSTSPASSSSSISSISLTPSSELSHSLANSPSPLFSHTPPPPPLAHPLLPDTPPPNPLLLPRDLSLSLKSSLQHPHLLFRCASSPKPPRLRLPPAPSEVPVEKIRGVSCLIIKQLCESETKKMEESGSQYFSTLFSENSVFGGKKEKKEDEEKKMVNPLKLPKFQVDGGNVGLEDEDVDIASICFLVARYYGDEMEARFWALVCVSFNQGFFHSSKSVPSPPEVTPIATEEQQESGGEGEVGQVGASSYFDGLVGSSMAPQSSAYRTSLLRNCLSELRGSSSSSSPSSSSSAAEGELEFEKQKLTMRIESEYIFQGLRDDAIKLLLETPPENPNFFMDGLKACVVAASISPSVFSNISHIVAMNNIASGKVSDGVQLLCLTGRYSDACRHLQNNHQWHQAATLAKNFLPPGEIVEVFGRWVRHLKSQNQKMEATKLALMCQDYGEVLHLLHEQNLFDVAALFYAALDQRKLSPEEGSAAVQEEDTTLLPLKQLLQAIHLDYGYFLYRVGLTELAQLYLNKSGQAGHQMIESLLAQKEIESHKEKIALRVQPP